MFKKDQVIYYIDSNNIIKKGIYKGTINSISYKEITHLYSEIDGNILINTNVVFYNKSEAKRFKDIL